MGLRLFCFCATSILGLTQGFSFISFYNDLTPLGQPPKKAQSANSSHSLPPLYEAKRDKGKRGIPVRPRRPHVTVRSQKKSEQDGALTEKLQQLDRRLAHLESIFSISNTGFSTPGLTTSPNSLESRPKVESNPSSLQAQITAQDLNNKITALQNQLTQVFETLNNLKIRLDFLDLRAGISPPQKDSSSDGHEYF